MKKNRFSINLFLLFVLLFFFFSQTFASLTSGVNVRIIVDEAKIRLEPSTESEVISSAKKEEVLEAEEKFGEWYKVTYTSGESGFTLSGYIHESEIQILEQHPVTQSAPSAYIQPNGGQMAPSYLRQKETGTVICSTLDFKYEHEIIGELVHYQEFGVLTLKDALESAINKGLKKFKEKAVEMGGDAVIGLRFLFANRTQKDEGRVLVYGTVIRFK